MHKLIYSMSASLDGFIAGHGGEIDWAAPGGELMRFHNEQTKEISAHLCGRGLCAGMLPWETEGTPVGSPGAGVRPALGGHPEVVFSRTLQQVAGNARLAQGDVASEVARVKAGPGTAWVSAGGAGFAAILIQLDLVDEYRMFVNPIVVGGGTPYFPRLGHRLSLELLETRTFGSRVVYLRYQRPAR